MKIKKYPGAERIALLITCAAVLQVAESFLPRLPVPGLRLGLANLVTMIAMAELGFAAAMEVAVLRCVIGSLVLGTFLSPAFILSLGASVTSTLVMSAVFFPMQKMKNRPLSITGVSVLGAVAHNLAQLLIVYGFMIHSKSILYLLPWLGISGVITGFITGIIAAGVSKKLGGLKKRASIIIKERPSEPGQKSINADPVFFVALAAVFAVAVMISTGPVFLVFSGAALILAAVISGGGVKKIFTGISKAWAFILFAALAPALFNGHGKVVFDMGFIQITEGGAGEGILYASRLALLMASAGLLSAVLGPKQTALGIEKLAAPLALAGVETGRLSVITALAWANFDGFWKTASEIAGRELKIIKPGISGIFASAENIAVGLYTGSAAYDNGAGKKNQEA